MRFDYKNISIGFLIGVICTIITVALIGDVEIETDFQFGDKATNKDISIIIIFIHLLYYITNLLY